MPTPESLARQQIDQLLAASGWIVQDRAGIKLDASRGVAKKSCSGQGLSPCQRVAFAKFALNRGASVYALLRSDPASI